MNSDVDNDGCFRGLVRLLMNNGGEDLKYHLDNAGRNATYFSSQIQNEIFSIISELIQEKTVDYIKSEERLFTVIADETQYVS